jgi:hypothetical protein
MKAEWVSRRVAWLLELEREAGQESVLKLLREFFPIVRACGQCLQRGHCGASPITGSAFAAEMFIKGALAFLQREIPVLHHLAARGVR